MKMKNMVSLVISISMLALVGCAATETSRSTGQVIDDAGIATQVKSKLLADPITDGLKIDVEVDSGNVQLNGFVDSAEQKKRATEVVRSISGISSVKNNLSVSAGKRTTGEYIDDKSLIARVKTALADDPIADALEIDVEANRGVISLGGFVETEGERDAAVTAAMNVEGVVRVINNLAVR